jgi:hypothetical protein
LNVDSSENSAISHRTRVNIVPLLPPALYNICLEAVITRPIESFMYALKSSEREKEIEELRHNDKVKEDALATLSDQVMKLMVEVQELKKQK